MNVLVGKQAPDFKTSAVLADGKIVDSFTLSEEIKGKYGLLFFYPLDFTFVCPSELIALDKRIEQFKKRNVQVIGISVDSQFTHNAWRNTPIEKGGIGPLGYPLVSDMTFEIAKSYGVDLPDGVALRGAFIIDKEGIVRSSMINDLPLGRNIDELLRLVDALQFHEKHGEVCPAGWVEGKSGMTATPDGVAKFLSEKTEEL
jgi:peroxiredoxin 2/4